MQGPGERGNIVSPLLRQQCVTGKCSEIFFVARTQKIFPNKCFQCAQRGKHQRMFPLIRDFRVADQTME